jgi:YVTN family beta-propeller protein
MNWLGSARGGAVFTTRTSARSAVLFAGAVVAMAACYSTGDGTAPPVNGLYYPTGLAVSPGGSVLYVANSDFDLQYNGGTLQSFDLAAIRKDAALSAERVGADCLPKYVDPKDANVPTPPLTAPLGEACAKPKSASAYHKFTRTIGAFATDLQVSLATFDDENVPGARLRRLFVPVRGNSSLTWASIPDDMSESPSADPFVIDCGAGDGGGSAKIGDRCGIDHLAGRIAEESSRGIQMPGEPFGMAQTPDGKYIAITHQSGTQTSLFETATPGKGNKPTLQFVVDDVPIGGAGIASVPLDPDAFSCIPSDFFPCGKDALRPAFLQTSRANAIATLLRFYGDIGDRELGADRAPATNGNPRPFLVREASYSISANADGIDSRGIAIDPSERIECKLRPGADLAACARLPARIFIANRRPASLLIGDVGDRSPGVDGAFDATSVRIHTSIPLTIGPSRLYLAPVVADDGVWSMRVFIVCFDSDAVYVFNPETSRVENIIRVGSGPFAMAFDPFTIEEVAKARFQKRRIAQQSDLQVKDGDVVSDLKTYRFGYIASFTKSYVQLLDLDNARTKSGIPDKSTFETVVFNLGVPQVPKGSK